MTDNTILPGTGDVIADEDIGGVKYQKVISGWGAAGAFQKTDIASGKPFPMQLRGSDGTDRSNLLPVSIAAGATAIAKAEDVASADADVGVPAMAVRKASPANTSGTDGDYEMLQMSAGRVWTNTLLGDGTNAVAVKAASTAAVAGDPSLVVALSPNTALPSRGYSAAVALTRTADTNAYAANDVLGAATGSTAALTFASMGPSGADVMITSAALEIDASAVISGETSYRLYLYNVTPPSALGDNVAWDLPSGDRASFLGYVDLGTPVDLGSTLYVQTDNINTQIKLSGTSIFAYLVTIGAYTPTSARVHKITLHTVA